MFILDIIQYRALYDYTPERPDEMAITIGDIIIVCCSTFYFPIGLILSFLG